MMKSDHHTHDVEIFERWGSAYERSWMQKRLFDPVHSAVLSQAASRFKPASVLDVGCGSGRLLRKVHDYWPEAQLSGVDPAQGMLEVARQLTPEARFYMGSGEALPLEDASVDLALSTISFHHWQDQAAGVREVVRVLRPGGYFLLADFTLPTWFAWLLPGSRFHSAAQMRALFEQAGLDIQAQPATLSRFVCITIGTKPADERGIDGVITLSAKADSFLRSLHLEATASQTTHVLHATTLASDGSIRADLASSYSVSNLMCGTSPHSLGT